MIMKILRNIKKHLFCLSIVFFVVPAFYISGFAKDNLLILRPEGNAFQDVIKGLSDELDEEFIIHQVTISDKTTKNVLTERISTTSFRLVVLMDNRSINLYKQWQKSKPDSMVIVPSISCMAVYLDETIEGIKEATGIYYEVPFVTSIINLREIFPVNIKKYGVVHRKFMREHIEKSKELCKREEIDLITFELPNKGFEYKYSLRKALKNLIKKENVNALIVPNDNALLKPELIRDVWIPLVNWYKKPVIVGVEVLVNPKIDFGVFAVLPDHINLGNQVAGRILEIKDNNWIMDNTNIDPPLSVIKVINLKKAKKIFGIDEKKCENIDKILQ